MVRSFLLLLTLATVAACSSVGPRTVPRDQFDYNGAIAESADQQLLLNLVRLRYHETPVFLKVASVISQYELTGSANATAGANTAFTGDDTATLGGRLAWTDKPTITYAPVSGHQFSRNLLTPVPPSALFGMLVAGWPAELVLPVTMWSLNDIDNDFARPSGRQAADPELFEVLAAWRRLRDAKVLGIRETGTEQKQKVVLYVTATSLPVEAERDLETFRRLLGLDPDAREFPVSYGLVPQEPGEIVALTGSVWEIMGNLAWYFDVPPEHVESGATGKTFDPGRPGSVPPIHVRFSKEEPDDAFVRVYKYGYWYYIEQGDRASKRVFSFLHLLLNLAEARAPDPTPLVTISS
jgi:predicted small lipoprotein YifL